MERLRDSYLQIFPKFLIYKAFLDHDHDPDFLLFFFRSRGILDNKVDCWQIPWGKWRRSDHLNDVDQWHQNGQISHGNTWKLDRYSQEGWSGLLIVLSFLYLRGYKELQRQPWELLFCRKLDFLLCCGLKGYHCDRFIYLRLPAFWKDYIH